MCSSDLPSPIGGLAHPIGVVDLLHLGGVFDDHVKRIDEIIKGVVTRSMTTWAPLDSVSCVLHPSAPAHHRIGVGHHEGDVVEAIVIRVAKSQAVVIVVAAHKGHDAGAIGQAEVEHRLQKRLRRIDAIAIEHRMGQSNGAVLDRALVGMGLIAP